MSTIAPLPRTSLRHVLAAERIKFGSIRSTRWTVILTIVLSAAFTALMAALTFAPPEDGTTPDEMIAAVFGPRPALGAVGFAFLLGQALIGVLGVLIVSSERGTGLIDATLAAVPRRGLVLSSKLAVSGAVSLSIGVVVGVVSFWIAAPVFAARGQGESFAHPATLQVLIGGAVSLGLIGILSTALAFLVRGTAAALGIVLGLLLIAPGIVQVIPVVGPAAASVLPSNLAAGMFLPLADAGWMPFAVGLAGLVAWAAAASVVAYVSFTRRDA